VGWHECRTLSGNCQGISECLESIHPEKWDVIYCPCRIGTMAAAAADDDDDDEMMVMMMMMM